MATTSFSITSSVYTEISTTGTALVTNECSAPVRIVFAGALPTVGTEDYMTLRTDVYGLAQVDSVPVGNIYARSDRDGDVCKVTVS